MENEVLYQFEIPYPWKRTLNGIYWITFGMFLVSIFLSWHAFVYTEHPPHWTSFYLSIFSFALILTGLALVMRYLLIHADKIKTPIRVWLTPYEIHFRKGRIKMDFSMQGLKSVRLILNDKIVMLETNYEKDEDWKKGWKVAFKRKNELAETDYRKFIEKTFLPFAELVIKRLKELNPEINVVKEDRRKRYR